MPHGVIKPILQKYWPDYQRDLIPPEGKFREGRYEFKLTINKVWRQVAIDASATLDELALVLLNSIDFDADHLYQFEYQTRYGTTQQIGHPAMMDIDLVTSEVHVGHLPLKIEQTMLFTFDFGDNWEFDVTLEKIEPGSVIQVPEVIGSHGKAPEQYPDGEDFAFFFDGDFEEIDSDDDDSGDGDDLIDIDVSNA